MKKWDLKSLRKNSDGKYALIGGFCEVLASKGTKIECFGVAFWRHFGDFWGQGEIVRIELSSARELHLEGWRRSDF